uniref:Putative secreted protein n=1 Tax=Anopheles triannulatus TaxID=58253 RepID=A0A2M4B0F6_9DIPT
MAATSALLLPLFPLLPLSSAAAWYIGEVGSHLSSTSGWLRTGSNPLQFSSPKIPPQYRAIISHKTLFFIEAIHAALAPRRDVAGIRHLGCCFPPPRGCNDMAPLLASLERSLSERALHSITQIRCRDVPREAERAGGLRLGKSKLFAASPMQLPPLAHHRLVALTKSSSRRPLLPLLGAGASLRTMKCADAAAAAAAAAATVPVAPCLYAADHLAGLAGSPPTEHEPEALPCIGFWGREAWQVLANEMRRTRERERERESERERGTGKRN